MGLLLRFSVTLAIFRKYLKEFRPNKMWSLHRVRLYLYYHYYYYYYYYYYLYFYRYNHHH